MGFFIESNFHESVKNSKISEKISFFKLFAKSYEKKIFLQKSKILQVIQVAFGEVKNIGFNNGGVEKTSLFVMSGYTISSVYFA